MVIWIFEEGPGMFTCLWNGKNASLEENNWKRVFYPESFLRGAVLSAAFLIGDKIEGGSVERRKEHRDAQTRESTSSAR
jgi:hypothetical protein